MSDLPIAAISTAAVADSNADSTMTDVPTTTTDAATAASQQQTTSATTAAAADATPSSVVSPADASTSTPAAAAVDSNAAPAAAPAPSVKDDSTDADSMMSDTAATPAAAAAAERQPLSVDIPAATPAPAAAAPSAPAADYSAINAATYDVNAHRGDVWLTPAQASIENKKLKPGCGWRFHAVLPATKPAALSLVDLTPRQPRRSTKGGDDDETPAATPMPSTPSGRGKAGRPSLPPVTPTLGKGKSSSKSKTVDPVDEKTKQLAELEARIAALHREQAILSGTPLPASSSSSVASYPEEKAAAKSSKKRKSHAPAPVSIPSTPALNRGASQAQTPSATPSTPGISRTGRNLKAPQLYAHEQEAGEEAKKLKKVSDTGKLQASMILYETYFSRVPAAPFVCMC